jgi:hypothetical protein
MLVAKIESFPVEQLDDPNALAARLGQQIAQATYPQRLVVYSRPADLSGPRANAQSRLRALRPIAAIARPLVRAISALLGEGKDVVEDQGSGEDADHLEDIPHPATVIHAFSAAERGLLHALIADVDGLSDVLARPEAAGDAQWAILRGVLEAVIWPVPWLNEQDRFYTTLQERFLRRADHYLIAWQPSEVSAEAVIAGWRHATGRAVERVAQLPALLPGAYRVEHAQARLRPLQPGQPWLAILDSYELRGEIDVAHLFPLLDLPYDVTIAIDIATMPRRRAMQSAEWALGAAEATRRDPSLVDVRAERAYNDAYTVMHALTQEGLHKVSVVAAVSADDAEQLELRVSEVQGLLGSALRLRRVAGAQDELAKYFSVTPSKQIDAPHSPWPVLSSGVGCLAGLVGYHRPSCTDGPLWGLDSYRDAPLFLNLFGQGAGAQAAHVGILGTTGYGKTFFLNQMTLRAAAEHDYVVIGIDAFKNGLRVQRAAGAGARCNMIGLEHTINIMDVVFRDGDEDEPGAWITNQVQQVIGLLALVMGTPGSAALGDLGLEPRVFSPIEWGVLDQTLHAIYTDVDPDGRLDEMPILDDLIAALDGRDEVEAALLARELRFRVTGSLARSFNGITTVDWHFGYDINYFDISSIANNTAAVGWLSLYYAQIVGAINRYMRDPHRDTRRNTLLLLDEFHYLSRVPALLRLAEEICKVARKYRFAAVMIDQNPSTFFGSDSGKRIWQLTAAKILFRLDTSAAREVGTQVSDLQPEHLTFLTQAQRGEAIGIFGNNVHMMHTEASPRELRYLAGS